MMIYKPVDNFVQSQKFVIVRAGWFLQSGANVRKEIEQLRNDLVYQVQRIKPEPVVAQMGRKLVTIDRAIVFAQSTFY